MWIACWACLNGRYGYFAVRHGRTVFGFARSCPAKNETRRPNERRVSFAVLSLPVPIAPGQRAVVVAVRSNVTLRRIRGWMVGAVERSPSRWTAIVHGPARNSFITDRSRRASFQFPGLASRIICCKSSGRSRNQGCGGGRHQRDLPFHQHTPFLMLGVNDSGGVPFRILGAHKMVVWLGIKLPTALAISV